MSKGRWRVTINPCSHDYVEDDESGHMRCMFCKQIVFERDEKGRKIASDLAKKNWRRGELPRGHQRERESDDLDRTTRIWVGCG
jgi:hypothetical protein